MLVAWKYIPPHFLIGAYPKTLKRISKNFDREKKALKILHVAWKYIAPHILIGADPKTLMIIYKNLVEKKKRLILRVDPEILEIISEK